MNTPYYLIATALLLLGSWNTAVFGQVECSAAGRLRGIRIDGELMAFTASIDAVLPAGAEENQDGGQFSRDGNTLTVTGSLAGGAGRRRGPGGGSFFRGETPSAGVSYRAGFKLIAPGTVEAGIEITSTTNASLQGVHFTLALPAADYAGGSAQWIEPNPAADAPITLATSHSSGTNLYLRTLAKGVRVLSRRRQIELRFPSPVELVIQNIHARDKDNVEVSFPVSLGNLTNGQTVHAAFTIKAAGDMDKSPARLALDPSQPGREYDGMGGNFRIQSPADAAQIRYNLDHLRVAWGRVAMPLDRWQPEEDANPTTVNTNALNDNVRESMEMARKLAQKDIPFIISIWAAPAWALETNGVARRGSARINPEKWDKVCQSIGTYLEYLKQNYGAEPALFSFNESDMGINVLQSPPEHAETIKRLGSYFAAHGLKTRMLLGDTGNPAGDYFIDAALADTNAGKYIGAVSFHSWNGGTVGQYTHFSEAAQQLHVPLLVAEGGLDPAAWQHRNLFLEPWYCVDEIAQYVEICRIAQPRSILHWQLTADYSILTGGYDGRPLQPAQRFWDIRQLGMTAAHSMAVPITSDNPKVVACAFADHGTCVVHLVNNGAARMATVTGLPADVKEMRVFVTDNHRGMQETRRVPVVRGTVEVPLDSMSFTSLAGNP
jgi:hypothetical protein